MFDERNMMPSDFDCRFQVGSFLGQQSVFENRLDWRNGTTLENMTVVQDAFVYGLQFDN